MCNVFEERPALAKKTAASRAWQECKKLRVPISTQESFQKELKMNKIHFTKQITELGEYVGEVTDKELTSEPNGYGRFVTFKEP